MAKVRLHRTFFRGDIVGVLDLCADVSVRGSQVLGERVRGENVEPIGEPFVHRSLEGMVGQAELGEVPGQNHVQTREAVEVRPPGVAN